LALEVRGLVKRYRGRVALCGVSFTLHRGEVLGFLGPNGAGKTTTIKSVVGLVLPDAGRVIVDGRDALSEPGARAGVGYAPEVPVAPPWPTTLPRATPPRASKPRS